MRKNNVTPENVRGHTPNEILAQRALAGKWMVIVFAICLPLLAIVKAVVA